MKDRSDAQRRADKRYAEKTKGKYKQFAVNLSENEYNTICDLIESSGMTKADFLRWCINNLKEQ